MSECASHDPLDAQSRTVPGRRLDLDLERCDRREPGSPHQTHPESKPTPGLTAQDFIAPGLLAVAVALVYLAVVTDVRGKELVVTGNNLVTTGKKLVATKTAESRSGAWD